MRFGQSHAADAALTLARPRAPNTERESNHAREWPVRIVRPPAHTARFAAVLRLALQFFPRESEALELSRTL